MEEEDSKELSVRASPSRETEQHVRGGPLQRTMGKILESSEFGQSVTAHHPSFIFSCHFLYEVLPLPSYSVSPMR